MPINAKYQAHYEYGKFYHVFNRTTGSQLMFQEDENYHFFLHKFHLHLDRYLTLHSWCLLPNHFHFLIQVKSEHIILQHHHVEDINRLISKKFKNFFLAYSLSHKNRYGRKDNLFAPKYRHIRLYTNDDIKHVMMYIHRNPLHHEVGEWGTFEWSSFYDMRTGRTAGDSYQLVTALFGSIKTYIAEHEEYVALTGFSEGSEPFKGSEPSENDQT